jgi:tetratricopeptide (TPR) repeat protein
MTHDASQRARGVALAALGLALLVLVAGCGGSVAALDRRDRGDALMERARETAARGDARGAAELYQRVIDQDAGNARAHLDLGILLQDQFRDYVPAIYHYRRYLALRPETEKHEMIEHRVRVAEQLFAAKMLAGRRREREEAGMGDEPDRILAQVVSAQAGHGQAPREEGGVPEAQVDWEDRARRLEQAVTMQEQRMEETEVRNAALENKLEKMDLLLARTRAERDAARVALADARRDAGQPPPARAAGPGVQSVVRTYRVKRGDTLSRIAGEVYGDAGNWKRIYRANEEILGGENKLRVGQVLVIP